MKTLITFVTDPGVITYTVVAVIVFVASYFQ